MPFWERWPVTWACALIKSYFWAGSMRILKVPLENTQLDLYLMRATLITFTYWNNYWWNLWWASHSSCGEHWLLADIWHWTMRVFVVTAHLRKSLSFLKPLQAGPECIICIKFLIHQFCFSCDKTLTNLGLSVAIADITGRSINVAHLIISMYTCQRTFGKKQNYV